MNAATLLLQGNPVSRAVAALLLAMSVASWVVIVWKAWLLRRAVHDVARSTAAFWQASNLDDAQTNVAVLDRAGLVSPLVAAARALDASPPGTLARSGPPAQQLTRLLRDALHAVVGRLQFGQILLATIGSTAPFVGLLGTVWGIYEALAAIASAGQITIDQLAGPVGEALVMTAAGLAVAIPAVLAYNILGRQVARIEADLEGFARDLLDLSATPVPAPIPAPTRQP
jgi:biopolymer transport protein ExbB